MFTIDNEIENRIREKKAKTISEKRISPHVVQIQMEIAILELKRQRLLEEIAQLKTRLRRELVLKGRKQRKEYLTNT